MKIKTGLGQDSHAFEQHQSKPLLLGGVDFKYTKGLRGNSDADVVLHALTNAISSITGKNILGARADALCKQGVIDSAQYLQLALDDLQDWNIDHIAISMECLTPKITPRIDEMKSNIAKLTGIQARDVGITATSGEGLTSFGQGQGIQVICIVTVSQ